MREMGNFLLLERTVGNVSSLLSTGLYQSHSQSSYPPLVTSQQGVFFILIKELTSEVYPYAFEISIKNIFYVRFWGFFLLFFSFPKAKLAFHFIYFFTNKGHCSLIFQTFHVILPQTSF